MKSTWNQTPRVEYKMYLQDIHQVFNGSYTEYMTSGTTSILPIKHKYVKLIAIDIIQVFILYVRHEFIPKSNTTGWIPKTNTISATEITLEIWLPGPHPSYKCSTNM